MATYTTPADEAHFAAIGRLTISWAQIELGIDIVVILFHDGFGGHYIEKEVPWSLTRKIKFIRKCINQLEWLEPIGPRVLALLEDIEKTSEFRHDIVHGIVMEYTEGSGEADMARLLRGQKPVAKKYFKVTTEQILREAVAAGKLAGRALKLATDLQDFVAMVMKETK